VAQREDNRRQILTLLRVRGPLTQANLARLTGLSPSTISSIVAELQASGTVKSVEDPNPRKKVGRPGSLIALDPSVGAFVGIDIEHERFMVLVADAAHNVLAEERRPLQRDHDAGAVMTLVAELIDHLAAKAGVDRDRLSGAGVGLAGPINLATGQIHPSSVAMSWGFVDVTKDLGKLLDLPVYLDNDANLGALAEMTWGAGRGVTEAAYIKADIGVGAALVLGGQIHRGAAGIAGEIGHSTIDDNGPVCRCGNRGCLEGFVGENALLQSLRPRYRPDLTFDDVVALAQGGDVVCRRVIADAGRLLGMQVASLCNLLNPSRVIVGGSLASAGELLLGPIRTSVEQRALPEAAGNVEIVPGELGDRAIALGGVALAMRQAGALGFYPEDRARTGRRDAAQIAAGIPQRGG
jgi:predicted NBD/HSP70 family sugar kinase